MKKIKNVIIGVFLGFLVGAFFLGNIFLFKKIGDKFINLIDRTNIKQNEQFQKLIDDFYLSFEQDKELDIFELEHVGIQRSQDFATDGNYSLAIDFPPGPKYPGISFDMFGQNLMDWSQKKEFSFDIFNATPKGRKLIIQIRSGRKYPKKQYKKEVNLSSGQKMRVVIPVEELGKKINTKQVSHLTIFLSNPRTSYRVYIDNMRVD